MGRALGGGERPDTGPVPSVREQRGRITVSTETEREDNGIAPQRVGEPVIQAISRAMQILSLFTDQSTELTLSEIVDRFGMGKATTHRYAMSLRQEGLLRYNARTGRYSLGARLIQLGRIAQESVEVLEVATPHLNRVAGDLNETAVLAIWEGAQPVVVRVAYPPTRVIFVGVRVGDRLTPRAAQSLVMRAYLEDGGSEELAEIRRRGYAVTTYETTGTVVIACPVFQDRQIVATVAVLATAQSMDEDGISGSVDRLRRAAESISAELGVGGRTSIETA